MPILLRIFLLALVCLAGPAGAADFAPEIIPPGHKWKVAQRVGADTRVWTFPDDYSRLGSLPMAERAAILEAARRIERDIDHVRRVGRTFFASPLASQARMLPDRELTLRDVIIAAREQSDRPLADHEPILASLPRYSRIHVVVPRDSLEPVRRELETRRLLERSRLHGVDTWLEKTDRGLVSQRPTRWVRDAFLPGQDNRGELVIFLPMAHSNVRDLAQNDLALFEQAFAGEHPVVRMPVFVRGGNIDLATVGKRRVLFVGEREFRFNEEVFFATTQFRPGRELLLEVLKRISGVDEIVVLPNSDNLFHLDMVMALPLPGVAAVVAPLDPDKLDPADAAVLARVRAELSRLGIRQVAVPTTTARIASFQSVANMVPFRDAGSGRPSALLPEYPDQQVTVAGRPSSLNQLIRQAYSRLGLRVVPLEERFFRDHGNTHCVMVGLS